MDSEGLHHGRSRQQVRPRPGIDRTVCTLVKFAQRGVVGVGPSIRLGRTQGRLYTGDIGTGSRAEAQRPAKPSATDVCTRKYTAGRPEATHSRDCRASGLLTYGVIYLTTSDASEALLLATASIPACPAKGGVPDMHLHSRGAPVLATATIPPMLHARPSRRL